MTLEIAITHAKRIRRNLVRAVGGSSLAGSCAIASLLLAEALDDDATLRLSEEIEHVPMLGHVWNVVEGVVIDITATQFDPDLRGVLVTREPKTYHTPVHATGADAVDRIIRDSWTTLYSYRPVEAAIRKYRAKYNFSVCRF